MTILDELRQQRPIRVWIDAVYTELNARTDEDLRRWYGQGLADAKKSVRLHDWHPDVREHVEKELVHVLRTDSAFVDDAVWFALCSGRYWSDPTLAAFVVWCAGERALSDYLKGIGRILRTPEGLDDETATPTPPPDRGDEPPPPRVPLLVEDQAARGPSVGADSADPVGASTPPPVDVPPVPVEYHRAGKVDAPLHGKDGRFTDRGTPRRTTPPKYK